MKVPAGADISEPWFDICVLPPNGKALSERFARNAHGLRACVKWLEENGIQSIDLVIEPTGRYGEIVAEYFHKRKTRVFLAQPLKFSKYAESHEIRIRSDRKAAYLLAEYCKERSDKLPQWQPKTNLEWELRDTVVLIRSLTKRTVAIRCQLACGLRSKFVKQQLEAELAMAESNLEQTLGRAKELIGQHPVLSNDFTLLCTIPGIADRSAVTLLTLIDFRRFRSSRSLACFLGLTSRKHASGISVREKDRISKRGSAAVRGALFMPARAARVHNPQIRQFSERLLAQGKHDFTVQMAVIRKLVVTAWSVIHSQTAWDANHVNPHFQAS